MRIYFVNFCPIFFLLLLFSILWLCDVFGAMWAHCLDRMRWVLFLVKKFVWNFKRNENWEYISRMSKIKITVSFYPVHLYIEREKKKVYQNTVIQYVDVKACEFSIKSWTFRKQKKKNETQTNVYLGEKKKTRKQKIII